MPIRRAGPVAHAMAFWWQTAVMTARFVHRDPWLAAATVLIGSGMGMLTMVLWTSCPWIPLILAGLACFLVSLLSHCRRAFDAGGLKAFLPAEVVCALEEPPFELIRGFLAIATFYAANFLRVLMLACMELDEAQRREILEGCDRDFRNKVFLSPTISLLPLSFERLFNGRERQPPAEDKVGELRPSADRGGWRTSTPSVDELLEAIGAEGGLRQRSTRQVGGLLDAVGSGLEAGVRRQRRASASPAPPSAGGSQLAGLEEVQPAAEPAPACGTGSSADGAAAPSRPARPSYERAMSVENIVSVLDRMEGAFPASKARATADTLERIMAEKAANTAVVVARSVVVDTLEYGKMKTKVVADGVRDAMSDSKTKVTAASAGVGAVTLGTAGGATGMVGGGLAGAALGVIPALFTFGLSIPIGAAIGGGTGLVLGASTAGTAGLLGGGAAGYGIYSLREERPALGPCPTPEQPL